VFTFPIGPSYLAFNIVLPILFATTVLLYKLATESLTICLSILFVINKLDFKLNPLPNSKLISADWPTSKTILSWDATISGSSIIPKVFLLYEYLEPSSFTPLPNCPS